MKELLSLLPRPSHYIGTEEGSVHKEPASVRLHCALAFPDLYEVGMSYLGHKILYTILNNREDIFAERVYAPCRETGRLLHEHGVSLATLESDTDIVKTHMFAFAITHELCFTNVLYMLELSGIPLRAADRGDDLFRWPLIVAGGGCAIASEPLAPFMDLMLLGEGEEMVPELCDPDAVSWLISTGPPIPKSRWSRSVRSTTASASKSPAGVPGVAVSVRRASCTAPPANAACRIWKKSSKTA